jgi:beta-lactamase regulating signal transducer with metallopeptidase domain
MEISAMLGSFAGFTFSLPESALGLSQSAASFLVTAVWQGVLVTACLEICLKLAPRTTAALRFGIWSAAFVVVAALPFLPFALAQFMGAPHLQSAHALIAASPKPWLQLDTRWSILLTALWAIASIGRAAILAADSLRLRELWRTATPTDSIVNHAEALTIPGRRHVEICATSDLERPAVIGFLAPRILIPEWLMAKLTPGELDQIVLHETEHLRRGDDWSNLLQKLSLVLFPLNPVLLWIERRLCKEREMACDDGVIRVTHAPRAYAACLTGLAERGLQHRTEALSLGAWQRRPELVHRVHSILLRKPALSPAAARGMAVVLGCTLVAGSAELARCPQLIAFVPAHAAEAAAKNHSQPPVEAAYAPKNGGIYGGAPSAPRLTQLKAVLPEQTAGRKEFAKAPALKHSAPLETAAFPLPSNEVARLDAAVGLPANSGREQRWIVLTTYEQLQSFDQDTVSDTGEASNAINQRSDQPARQVANQDFRSMPDRGTSRMTVTRLVFQVVPANAIDQSSHFSGQNSNGTPGQSSAKTNDQSTGQSSDRRSDRQPAALVPLRSGWFIIQL